MYVDHAALGTILPSIRDSRWQAMPTQPPAAPGSRAHVQALLTDPEIGTVEQLCYETGLSQPRLSRLCRREFGTTPKKLLRRARFGRMLQALCQFPYAMWRDFLDPQYFDQSHFIRDFRYFLGMAPSQFVAQPEGLQHAYAMRFTLAEPGGRVS